MNTIELKKSFHNLIDSINNENLLMSFYELMKQKFSSTDGHLWKRLSEKEQEDLLLALEESDQDENLINNEEMKKKHKKWL